MKDQILDISIIDTKALWITQEKAKKEAEENQKKLEKEKAYITYRDSIEFDKFEKEDWKIVFYKKVWEFIYN